MTSFRKILRCEEVEALRLPRRPMYQGGVRWEGSDLKESSGWRGGSEVRRVSSSPSLGVWVCRVEAGGGDGSKAWGLHLP